MRDARNEIARNGVLLVDKPAGMTSHDVVQKVRRLIRQRSIGHCGTLDPDATGLLVLTVGKATRLTRFLIGAPKTYEGAVTFGTATDTYDSSGAVTAEVPVGVLDRDQLEREMAALEGTYLQAPPPYSAKKVDGRRAYELAREGEEVVLEPKEVTVWAFAPIGSVDDDLAAGRIHFRLECGSGTYARSLAHDLGAKLGCGAHLSGLRRTHVGPFALDTAITIAELTERRDPEADLGPAWIGFDQIPLPFEAANLDAAQSRRIVTGQAVLYRGASVGEAGDWVKLVDDRGRFLAVGTVEERIGRTETSLLQPRIVFSG